MTLDDLFSAEYRSVPALLMLNVIKWINRYFI